MTPRAELERIAALVRVLRHAGTRDPNAKDIAATLQLHGVRGPMGLDPAYWTQTRVAALVRRINEQQVDDIKLPMGQPNGRFAIRAAFAEQVQHEMQRLREPVTGAPDKPQ